jgi:hypothetical protein
LRRHSPAAQEQAGRGGATMRRRAENMREGIYSRRRKAFFTSCVIFLADFRSDFRPAMTPFYYEPSQPSPDQMSSTSGTRMSFILLKPRRVTPYIRTRICISRHV